MRIRIFFVALLLCVLGAVLPARAADMTARQTAEAGAERILALLNDPAFKTPEGKPAIRQKIEAEVLSLFDFEEFSTRTVGLAGRRGEKPEKYGG